jgi:hypothetical protein
MEGVMKLGYGPLIAYIGGYRVTDCLVRVL